MAPLLTPLGEADAFVLDERTAWQFTPHPKMTRIMTPKNSAAYSCSKALSSSIRMMSSNHGRRVQRTVAD